LLVILGPRSRAVQKHQRWREGRKQFKTTSRNRTTFPSPATEKSGILGPPSFFSSHKSSRGTFFAIVRLGSTLSTFSDFIRIRISGSLALALCSDRMASKRSPSSSYVLFIILFRVLLGTVGSSVHRTAFSIPLRFFFPLRDGRHNPCHSTSIHIDHPRSPLNYRPKKRAERTILAWSTRIFYVSTSSAIAALPTLLGRLRAHSAPLPLASLRFLGPPTYYPPFCLTAENISVRLRALFLLHCVRYEITAPSRSSVVIKRCGACTHSLIISFLCPCDDYALRSVILLVGI
jgi:hypothetical protein